MWVLGINLRSPGLAGGAGPAQQFLSLRTLIWSTVTKDYRVKFASAISFIAMGHLLYTSHLCVCLICLGIMECLPVPLFLWPLEMENFEVRILNSVQWRPKADRNASSGSFCAETAWAAPEGRHRGWPADLRSHRGLESTGACMTVLMWNGHWPEGTGPGVRHHLFCVLWAKGRNERLLSGTDASSSCSSAHKSPALSVPSPLRLLSLSKLLAAEVKCISVEHRALPASQLGSLSKRGVFAKCNIIVCAGILGVCQAQR